MRFLHRIWDWIVGLMMIAISILIGGITALMFALPVVVGLGYFFDLKGKWGGPVFICMAIVIFTLLQTAGFYDFYIRRRVNYATGRAGVFHLIPRAIQRIRTGYELQGFVDAATGMPTTAQAPINAGWRAVVALMLTTASAGAFYFGATAKGPWTLVVAALGLIGTMAGLVLSAQVLLAYAGFIRRNT